MSCRGLQIAKDTPSPIAFGSEENSVSKISLQALMSPTTKNRDQDGLAPSQTC